MRDGVITRVRAEDIAIMVMRTNAVPLHICSRAEQDANLSHR
jgi:hypothetical protein